MPKFIFSNIEIPNGRYWTVTKIYKDVICLCKIWFWKALIPPVVDKHFTTSTAWTSPLSRTTYTPKVWHSEHDGVENASPFNYGYVTMLGIYVKFQGYLTWDKDKRGQFSTTQRSNMQDPSTRPRPPVSHMGDSSTSKSKRSLIIGRLANRLLRVFWECKLVVTNILADVVFASFCYMMLLWVWSSRERRNRCWRIALLWDGFSNREYFNFQGCTCVYSTCTYFDSLWTHG